jgi:uncharacterized tellurite resistance protein B-like protein
MRAYPQNSPLAAARIVALTMLCDGHLSKAEIDAVQAQGIEQRLGLAPGQWQALMRDLCEDLLASTDMSWHANCSIDSHMLAGLLAEVSNPALRLDALRLCLAVVDADAHLADGEEMVMNAAVEQWGLQHEMLRPAHESRLLKAA